MGKSLEELYPGGSWKHHPRPWRLVRRFRVNPIQQVLDVILDAKNMVVATSFGVGFEEFWQAYLESEAGRGVREIPTTRGC